MIKKVSRICLFLVALILGFLSKGPNTHYSMIIPMFSFFIGIFLTLLSILFVVWLRNNSPHVFEQSFFCHFITTKVFWLYIGLWIVTIGFGMNLGEMFRSQDYSQPGMLFLFFGSGICLGYVLVHKVQK